MKFVDEFRDNEKAQSLKREIHALAGRIGCTREKPLLLMEFCGGHTHAIFRYGLDKLTPPLEVALLRIASVDEVKRMKKAGRYDGYGLAIGADGTWHAFKRVRHGDTKAKP